MTEIQIPYLPSAQFFKILCRLGVNEPDIIGDSDSDPQIRTIGGTVLISASIPRFRYTEADGRTRVVYTKTETYNIQTSTGELFDADGNIGVNLLNTNSPQMDPQGWTYRATVRPNGGEPFDVPIPSDPEGGVFDLGDGLVFTPSTGITALETRVKALEDAAGNTTGLPENFDEAVQDIVGSMATGAGGSYNDAAGTITLPSGGGSSTIAADDTPAAPAEGSSASYLVTSAVVWPAGLVWSTDPDGGTAPTITGTALVSLFTLGGTTRAIMGATFPAGAAPADTTAPTWTATFAMGTPTSSAVVVTASALASDNSGSVTYEVSYDNAATWAAIVPSGSNFTLAGSPSTTYATTKLRAKDAAGNYSTPVLSVPSYTLAASTDVTLPTVGTMAASSITSSGFTLTVSGAADEAGGSGLHATPYAFTTDNGETWTAYQASPVYAASGLAASTTYSCNWRVRDAAGNVSTGTAQTVTTGAPATPLPVTAGLVGHWDPSDEATRTMTNDTLTQLADKSGGSRHLVKAPEQGAPTLTTINGITAMAFGVARLQNRAGFPMSGTGNSYTLAFVATPSSAARAYLLEFGISASTRDAVISNYGGKSYERYSDGLRYDISAGATGHHVITITRSGDAWSSTLDGVAAGSGSNANAAIAAPNLWVGGSNILTTDHATAAIGEIVLYDTALSAGDLDLVEAYLKTKWGVA